LKFSSGNPAHHSSYYSRLAVAPQHAHSFKSEP